MTRFEKLLYDAVTARRDPASEVTPISEQIGALYVDREMGRHVAGAVADPFFPLTLFVKHTVEAPSLDTGRIAKAGEALGHLSRMFLRIRADIDRRYGNDRVTCIDLNGDALQSLPADQWCSFCGECCRLSGTVPDPPASVIYPGYWYAYIAGDGPVLQKYCPFLFELPPQQSFFCAIHEIKPRTCLKYGKADCLEKNPGKARA
jgi:hypothetical protein